MILWKVSVKQELSTKKDGGFKGEGKKNTQTIDHPHDVKKIFRKHQQMFEEYECLESSWQFF